MKRLRSSLLGLLAAAWLLAPASAQTSCVMPTTGPATMAAVMTALNACLANIRFPGYQSGAYVTGRMFNAAQTGTQALAANTLYVMPLILDGGATWTKISINVTATGTAANCRLGAFNAGTDGGPSTLLFDGGVASVGTTGTKDVTISQTMIPAFYYGGIVCDGTVTITAGTPGINQDVTYTEAIGITAFGINDTQISRAFTYGALSGASPFGAVTRAAAGVPIIALKK